MQITFHLSSGEYRGQQSLGISVRLVPTFLHLNIYGSGMFINRVAKVAVAIGCSVAAVKMWYNWINRKSVSEYLPQ